MQRQILSQALDLRGVTCPMAFVKTRIHLDKCTPGEVTRILYEQTPANEPLVRSICSLGHKVLSETRLDASDAPTTPRPIAGSPPSDDVELTMLEIEVKT